MNIHQLLMGKHLAVDPQNAMHSMAAQMANFCYVLELPDSQAILVDAAWDVDGVLAFCDDRKLSVVCGVFTHRHLDHTGGRVVLRGNAAVVPGLAELAARGIPVKLGRDDVEFTTKQTGVKDIGALVDGDEIAPGVTILHTPGHTPGSICVLVEDGSRRALLTGDTLFIDSCGRTDLAESSPQEMASSLLRLSKLPEDCMVLPGHDYATVQQSSIKRERERNFAMRGAMGNNALQMSRTSSVGVLLPDYLSACRRALHHQG